VSQSARPDSGFEEIVGKSADLNVVRAAAKQLAATDAAVLITGERGSGKTLLAGLIHRASPRKSKSFIQVDCFTTSRELIERELFGYAKGAFDGAASDKTGSFELANRGTLFVNEIARFPLDLQPKLVRVLQRGEFEPLGSTRIIHVDVRLIAASRRLPERQSVVHGSTVHGSTHHPEKRIAGNRLHPDLYDQFNQTSIRMPALRKRREDIPLLVNYYVEKFARRMNKDIETIEPETMEALRNYDWPGNVRQLENFIQRAVILTEGSRLKASLDQL